MAAGSISGMLSSSRHLHGRNNPRIRAASANIALQGAADFRLAGLRRLLQESDDRKYHAWCTVTALQRVGLDEGVLHRMEFAVLLQTFNRRDLFAGDSGHARHARSHGRALNQHGACAAMALAASVFRAGEFQFVAKDPEQHARRVYKEPVVLLVDDEFHSLIL